VQQSVQEIPAIISTAKGGSSQIRNPYGTVATGPYGSFATPYTPGWGVPGAGYASVGVQSGGLANFLPWILGAGVLLLVMRGRS
jgi:hypothetical protein